MPGTFDRLSFLAPGEPLQLTEQELLRLRSDAELLREEDTSVQGWIRLFRLGDLLLAQEQDARGTLYLRRLADLPTAERFFAERLATYDRMWDGCGCRVDPRRVWPEPGSE